MASVKDKKPAARGPGAKPANKPVLNQRELVEKAGKNFEDFVQGARQQNERATEMHARLRALGLEGLTTREQFRDAVQGTDLSAEGGAERFVELLALAKDFASLTPLIEEVPSLAADAVDIPPTKEEDQPMSSLTQEVLDARLETIETRMDGRIATMEAKIDGKFAGVDSKFAELRTEMHKGFADMTKWIVATVLGVGALSIGIMTFLLNNAAPKVPAAPAAAPAPIIIYAQPAPAATAPSPAASPKP
ncbi:hypothetical protein [Duganella sp. HH105]|uniref:hypothetical protein n=1 Tax=Duganella sp. HH105 TaxID=1781067 RepID=UPI000894104F|nr:hypothetical protein [Duganella sp. HH105]OEZ64158.1 hypothetical protein DUGA6_06630 [Duganella sp. HH105]